MSADFVRMFVREELGSKRGSQTMGVDLKMTTFSRPPRRGYVGKHDGRSTQLPLNRGSYMKTDPLAPN